MTKHIGLDWNHVNAQVSDATKGANVALEGMKNAGTVFGRLNQSILDEQQRAVENADREKLFNENVRQWDEGHQLNKDQFQELKDQYQQTFEYNKETRGMEYAHKSLLLDLDKKTLEEQIRSNMANESLRGGELSMRGKELDLKYQQQALALDEKRQDLEIQTGKTDLNSNLSRFNNMTYEERASFQQSLGLKYTQALAQDAANGTTSVNTKVLNETLRYMNAVGNSVDETGKLIIPSSSEQARLAENAQVNVFGHDLNYIPSKKDADQSTSNLNVYNAQVEKNKVNIQKAYDIIDKNNYISSNEKDQIKITLDNITKKYGIETDYDYNDMVRQLMNKGNFSAKDIKNYNNNPDAEGSKVGDFFQERYKPVNNENGTLPSSEMTVTQLKNSFTPEQLAELETTIIDNINKDYDNPVYIDNEITFNRNAESQRLYKKDYVNLTDKEQALVDIRADIVTAKNKDIRINKETNKVTKAKAAQAAEALSNAYTNRNIGGLSSEGQQSFEQTIEHMLKYK